MCYGCGTSLMWTPLGQKKVSLLVRCPDFRGCNVHKQGVWDSQMCPVYRSRCPQFRVSRIRGSTMSNIYRANFGCVQLCRNTQSLSLLTPNSPHPCPNWIDGKVHAEIEFQVLTHRVSFQCCLWHILVPEFEKGSPLTTFKCSNEVTLQNGTVPEYVLKTLTHLLHV